MPLAAVIPSEWALLYVCVYTCVFVCMCVHLCFEYVFYVCAPWLCVYMCVCMCVCTHKKTQPRSEWSHYSWWTSSFPFSYSSAPHHVHHQPPPSTGGISWIKTIPSQNQRDAVGQMDCGRQFFALSTTFKWKQRYRHFVLHINIKLSPHVFRTIFNMDVLEAYNALKSAERYFEVWISKWDEENEEK